MHLLEIASGEGRVIVEDACSYYEDRAVVCMKGKRLVIWCLSVQEFTESYQGWQKVPVIR